MECIQLVTIYPKRKFKKLTQVQRRLLEGKDRYVIPESKPIQVPCGKCAFCLTNRRSSWMFRVHHEMRTQSVPGWFLTLTYSEGNVRRTATGRLSLRFRDVQLFLKRVRKSGYYCKYICVGEYGGQTHRPHYHCIMWTDCPSDKLEKYWRMGHIHFGKLTMASAMYTLKYIIQPKIKDDPEIEPTRAQFSKGLGLSYLSIQVYEWHTRDEENPVMFAHVDGQKVALPRYYKAKIFTKHQMKQQNIFVRMEAEKKLLSIKQQIEKKGIEDWKSYYRHLRELEAGRIISQTKFNQTL